VAYSAISFSSSRQCARLCNICQVSTQTIGLCNFEGFFDVARDGRGRLRAKQLNSYSDNVACKLLRQALKMIFIQYR